MAITYHTEKTGFAYKGRRLTSRWLGKFLDHDYLTDIITFDYCQEHGGKRIISGDLAIGVDCVRDNAALFGTGFDRELKRVIVHGVLHLLGYKDKKEAEQAVMRDKEDHYLCLLDNMA